jgi:hypothetical protein
VLGLILIGSCLLAAGNAARFSINFDELRRSAR